MIPRWILALELWLAWIERKGRILGSRNSHGFHIEREEDCTYQVKLAIPYYDTPLSMVEYNSTTLVHLYFCISYWTAGKTETSKYVLCYNYRNLPRCVDKANRSSVRLLLSQQISVKNSHHCLERTTTERKLCCFGNTPVVDIWFL